MRFQVPQFIDVEDKIFGPFTLRQFIYLAGGGGAVVVFFRVLPGFLAFLLALPVVVLALALAFYKINNKPFISVVEAFAKYIAGEKLYIWKKVDKKVVKKDGEASSNPQVFVPKLSDSKLKDLSWSIDVSGNKNEPDPEREV
jgi:hypothetical protein